jgi:hypothetical protein
LGAIGETVEKEVYGQEEKTPGSAGIVGGSSLGLLLAARVQGEDGNASGDRGDDEVLVEWVAATEEGYVEEHDGQQLTALGEQKGDVVNMGEAGVAKGAGETAGDGDEGERCKDAGRRNDGRNGAI